MADKIIALDENGDLKELSSVPSHEHSGTDITSAVEEADKLEGKSATDFVQNKNTEGTIYLKTVNNTLRYSTDDTNYIIIDTLTDTYGLKWNKVTDSYTRLNDAEGKTRSYFDNIYPWAGMKRCVLTDS